jgi:V/A-type H+-transporting ATPase subunit C
MGKFGAGAGVGLSYAVTRVRVMKGDLISQDAYTRMLKMDINEIARFLEETQYKREIDSLGTAYSGVELIERALNLNMANAYQKILAFCMGDRYEFLKGYLRRWDIWNIKMVMRGKATRAKKADIEKLLILAGEYDKGFFARLIDKFNTLEEVIGALKDTPFYDALETQSTSLPMLEHRLDRYYYSNLLKKAKGSRGKLLNLVKMEIDIVNIMMLLKLKKSGKRLKESGIDLIAGGKYFPIERLVELERQNVEEIVSAVKKSPFGDYAPARISGSSLTEMEDGLKRYVAEYGLKLLKEPGFTITPMIGYFIAKKTEADNIRMLTRGKQSKLQESVMASQMILRK